jgi:ketosteroid isomerase-like protein
MNWAKLCVGIAVVFLSFTFGQANQEPTDKQSEQEVRQMIEKYKRALLRRDVDALEKIWADDYTFVNASGDVLTKEQRLANIKSGATALDSIKEDDDVTLRVYQNSAVTTSRIAINGQYSGQPVSGKYRSTLVWVKGSSGWQLVSNQLTALAPK